MKHRLIVLLIFAFGIPHVPSQTASAIAELNAEKIALDPERGMEKWRFDARIPALDYSKHRLGASLSIRVGCSLKRSTRV